MKFEITIKLWKKSKFLIFKVKIFVISAIINKKYKTNYQIYYNLYNKIFIINHFIKKNTYLFI